MHKLDLAGQPLSLDYTMPSGQAFRWKRHEDGTWSGVVQDKLMELQVESGVLLWRTYPSDDEALVYDYLRLSDDVNAIYSQLRNADPHVGELIDRFHGLRLLRQDPTETLLSFICSAANSIPRIMAAIDALSARYGDLICEKDEKCYHAFPSVKSLANADVDVLQNTASLGFRGANIRKVAEQLQEKGEGWLHLLRNVPYEDARDSLMEIRGVGAKIADCVCLFALNKDESVPVDTHIKQVAQRYFLPDLKTKSITDLAYRRIRQAFIERYGNIAGWAQAFLYYEDLLRTRELGRGLK